MTKIKEKLLIITARELTEILGLEPSIEEEMKEKKTSVEPLIKEAAELLALNDELTKETLGVLQELFVNDYDEIDKKGTMPEGKATLLQIFLGLGILKEPEKEEKDEKLKAVNEDLFEEVDSAEKMKDLRDIAKSNDEFKEIRGKLSSYKSTSELRNAMLDILETEPGKEKEKIKLETVFKKEEKKIKGKIKSPVKEIKKKMIQQTYAQIFVGILDENIPRTVNELIVEVTKRYHSGSVAGAKTFTSIYIQILKEIGLIEKNEKGQYFKTT